MNGTIRKWYCFYADATSDQKIISELERIEKKHHVKIFTDTMQGAPVICFLCNPHELYWLEKTIKELGGSDALFEASPDYSLILTRASIGDEIGAIVESSVKSIVRFGKHVEHKLEKS